jgi:hypothetical protein
MRPQLEIDRAAHRIAGQAILVDVVGSYHVVLPAEVIIEIFKPDADAIVDSVVHAAADRPARVGPPSHVIVRPFCCIVILNFASARPPATKASHGPEQNRRGRGHGWSN